MVVRVRKLEPSDDRSRFTCGDPDLDSFFRQHAAKNQFEYFVGTTYVAVDEENGVVRGLATEGGPILGFVTICPGAIAEKMVRKAVGRGARAYPLPILRIARLGVASAIQKGGIGNALLGAAFDIAIAMSSDAGCSAVLVDAKPGAVSYYERYGFIAIPNEEVDEGESNARPRQTMMFLPMKDIIASQDS